MERSTIYEETFFTICSIHLLTYKFKNFPVFYCKYNKKSEQRKMKKQYHCTLFETYKYFHYLSFRDIKIFKEQKMDIFHFFIANLII